MKTTLSDSGTFYCCYFFLARAGSLTGNISAGDTHDTEAVVSITGTPKGNILASSPPTSQ